MAASATRFGEYIIPGGNGKRAEYGSITYDSDATVEVGSILTIIESANFVEVVSGGSADLPSVDETLTAGLGIKVPSDGDVTVDTASSNSRSFLYTFIGY